jgi:hypothetical protein
MTVPLTTGIGTVPTELSEHTFGSQPHGTESWTALLGRAVQPAKGLGSCPVPKRESILGNWFRQGDLGFVYGPRGLGKTWLSMFLARRIAEGGQVAHWAASHPRRVLYIDGEMALDALRERDAALATRECAEMLYLQHEAIFHEDGAILNLAEPAIQAAVSEYCKQQQVEVLFLDNLSCLFSGIKENDADAWEKVLPWLLNLRRSRIAVVFIAHAGRNGFIRGTSRREDAAFWIIQLSHVDGPEGPGTTGARFVARFDKNRNSTEDDCPPIEWTFHRSEEGQPSRIEWKPVSGLEKLKYWLENGLNTASDIALEMGLSKGRVSQLAKIAMDQGWLRKHGQTYVLLMKENNNNNN